MLYKEIGTPRSVFYKFFLEEDIRWYPQSGARIGSSDNIKKNKSVFSEMEGRSAFKILTGKPTGNRPLGRPRSRWEDNITMDVEEIGINTRNWVDSAQDRGYWRALVNAALNLRIS